MIKRTLILFVLLFSMVTASWADEQRKIKLDDDKHSKETIETEYFNIFVELVDVEEKGTAKVRIELENASESKLVALFETAYNEKTLKKMRPQIRYDKTFPGSKGQRVIDACKDINSDILLSSSDKSLIMILPIKDEEVVTATLPIHILQNKSKNYYVLKKSKRIILEKILIELEIAAELKPGETYVNITKECDELLKECEGLSFCKNEKHEPSLAEQKKPYQDKIDTLIKKIEDIIEANGWYSSEKRYKLYAEQIERLKSINLADKEIDCGKHVVIHRCRYCNLSLQQISHKLDDIYQDIYSSSDRSVAKSEKIRSVRAMYDCAKRRKDWRRSNYKTKIERLYKEINQL